MWNVVRYGREEWEVMLGFISQDGDPNPAGRLVNHCVAVADCSGESREEASTNWFGWEIRVWSQYIMQTYTVYSNLRKGPLISMCLVLRL